MLFYLQEKKQGWADINQLCQNKKEGKGAGGRGAGVDLHASHSIRGSRVCSVHVDVSLRASVAGERQELPRA